MDSAGVIPELNSTLPPVPHFSFSAIASPGNGAGSMAANTGARRPLQPLLETGPHKRNLRAVNSKVHQQLLSQPTSDFGCELQKTEEMEEVLQQESLDPTIGGDPAS